MTQCKTWDEFIEKVNAAISSWLEQTQPFLSHSFSRHGKKMLVENFVAKRSFDLHLMDNLIMSMTIHSEFGCAIYFKHHGAERGSFFIPMSEVQRVHMQFELEKKL